MTGAASYVWQPGNISGPTLRRYPPQTTTYTVTTVKDGGGDTAQTTVFVGACDACCPVAND